MVKHEGKVGGKYFAPVEVQAFPDQKRIRMSRNAALHLYRLLQRYKWCLAVNDYADRWQGFWTNLKYVERVFVVLAVMANCDGIFGRRLIVSNLPTDFEAFEDDTRNIPISNEIYDEFTTLLAGYFEKMGGQKALRQCVRESCPKEFALLTSLNAVDRVLGLSAWICPDQVKAESFSVFVDHGWDTAASLKNATMLSKCVLWFYESRNPVIC